MTPAPDVDVVVVGAGPAGLATSRAAARAGRSVLLLDGGETGDGTGLTLWPNATAALARLGLDGIDGGGSDGGRAEPSPGMRIVRPDGRVLQSVDAQGMRRACGGNGMAITRRALLEFLRERLPDEVVRRTATALRVEPGPGTVRVHTDGDPVTAAVAVGADGRHSRVRAALWGPPPERALGTWVVLGVSPVRLDGHPAEMTIGHGRQFGLFPLPDGAYWFAADTRPPRGEVLDAVRDVFAGWHPPIGEVVAATPAGQVSVHEMADRPPPGPWGRGPVTLVGDAAHLAAPTMGQGTCHAFEDAVALGNALAGSLEPAGLRRYEAARAARTRALVQRSHRAAISGRWSHPAVCGARDLAMRLTPATALLRQMRGMFVFDDADVLAG